MDIINAIYPNLWKTAKQVILGLALASYAIVTGVYFYSEILSFVKNFLANMFIADKSYTGFLYEKGNQIINYPANLVKFNWAEKN